MPGDVAVPENHWEYHMRKNANGGKGDAAYNGLDYIPVCTHMPVCNGQCNEPTFMWVCPGPLSPRGCAGSC